MGVLYRIHGKILILLTNFMSILEPKALPFGMIDMTWSLVLFKIRYGERFRFTMRLY